MRSALRQSRFGAPMPSYSVGQPRGRDNLRRRRTGRSFGVAFQDKASVIGSGRAPCRDAPSHGLKGRAVTGAALGGMLVCLCSRLTLADNTIAILIVSTERAARDLSLPDGAHRLLADLSTPTAKFTADGELIDAPPSAQDTPR